MKFTAAQIAMLINGQMEGDPQASVGSFGKIEEAIAGQLAFLANPKYEEFLYTTGASIIIVNDTLELKQPLQATLIRVPDAYTAFASLLTKYQEIAAQQLTGIQEPSYRSSTAKIGDKVFIGAFAYLGDGVIIGNNVKIHPQVYIGDNVRIGDNTVLHPGVKIYHNCVVGKT
jgi:UDP-3-O-[3-hydroxymyristoyl] glucosamine N-acyltransferase